MPQLFSAWESNWKEWIEPAPFVNKKDPARFYKQTRQSIGQYSLGQTLFQVGTFDDDVEVLVRKDFGFCRNQALDVQAAKTKFLLAGSSWAQDGQSKLTLKIQSGKVNEKEDVAAKGDPFVTVKVGNRERYTKTVKSEPPEWNEELTFDGATYADATKVLLILQGRDGSKNNEIGTATLSLFEAKSNMPGGNVLQHYSVPVKDQDGEETGSIELDAVFYVEQLPEGKDEDEEEDGEPKARGFAAPEGPGYDGVAQVTFNVVKAEIYEKHDLIGKDDPYVQIKIGDVTNRTKTINKTQNPVWNETVVFEGVTSANAQAALITIWDDDLVTRNDLVGSLTVDLLPFKGKKQHVTLVLKDEKGKAQAKLDLDVVLTPKA